MSHMQTLPGRVYVKPLRGTHGNKVTLSSLEHEGFLKESRLAVRVEGRR